MNSKWMNPLGAAWLTLESRNTPLHLGTLAIFNKPKNCADDYIEEVAAQFSNTKDAVAPWNYKLASNLQWGLSKKMIPVKSIDLDYHFRHIALPSPGGERQIGAMVSDLHSQPLDSGYPLWQCFLIEGLENNRFALYIKVHRALMGDISLIPLLRAMMSTSARKRNLPPPWSVAIPSSLTDNVIHDWEGAEFLEQFLGSNGLISGKGKAIASLAQSVLKARKSPAVLGLKSAPTSTLNRHINRQRRFSTQHYQVKRIQRLADATNCQPDEILTYLCGTSLRRFFKEYNALPRSPLIACAPVSLNEKNTAGARGAVAFIGVSMGTHIGDPLARLDAIKKSVQSARNDQLALPNEASMTYTLLRSAPLIASQIPILGGLIPPSYNLEISSINGSDKPLYFNGARLNVMYSLAELLQHNALSMHGIEYAGSYNIGLTGARDTLPHLQRLAVYMGKAVADLEDILGIKGQG